MSTRQAAEKRIGDLWERVSVAMAERASASSVPESVRRQLDAVGPTVQTSDQTHSTAIFLSLPTGVC